MVQDAASLDQAAEAEHEREQPDEARDTGLVAENHLELSEVDLRLIPSGVSKRTSKAANGAGRTSAVTRSRR
jgi:hypothetical protein